MTYEHVPRFGIYFVGVDVFVQDDQGNLVALSNDSFRSFVQFAYV
jgi:hypothetical protein